MEVINREFREKTVGIKVRILRILEKIKNANRLIIH